MGLSNYIAQVSSPSSSAYRQYTKSADQITSDYGPLASSYSQLVNWAQANGLTVVTQYANRLLLDVTGPASAVEQALYVNLNYYLRSDGSQFYAPDRNPSLNVTPTVSGITRLNDIAKAKPLFKLGDGGLTAADMRQAYIPCASSAQLDGTGQCVGIVALDDTVSDQGVQEYMQNVSGLAANYVSNYRYVHSKLPGFTQTVPNGGSLSLEYASDVEMALAMAPGATVVTYEGSDIAAIFNTMFSDTTSLRNAQSAQ